MEEAIVKEIQRLKEELEKKRREVQDLKELVHEEIERPFPANMEELSERELETYISEHFPSLKTISDTRPDKKPITSHRRIFGRPIVFFKRFLLKSIVDYNGLFLAKQVHFNRQSIDLYQALLLQARNNKKRMKHIQEKLRSFEENLAVFGAKLEDLRTRFEQTKTGTANHKNEPQRS
jgi:regulator of replication initiation timing